MTRSQLSLVIAIVVVGWTTTPLRASEPPKGGFGLMASLQSEQLDLTLPYWCSPSIVVAPSVRLVKVGDSYSDVGVGGTLRCYRRRATVSPYFGLRGMALIMSPKNGDGWTDILFGSSFGGDYFFEQHFSVGVEAQLNLTFSADSSTRFGNPGRTNINTAMGAFVAVYF